jgi:pimeloyl-ACP methyl ester carboxylesterase
MRKSPADVRSANIAGEAVTAATAARREAGAARTATLPMTTSAREFVRGTAFRLGRTETARHVTAWIDTGPADGPLMFFLHGWPELGLVWRAQLEYFAAAGWHCVAPDMRGYGDSAVPATTEAYTMREMVADMAELHDAFGGAPALWVGHDWGSAVAWALAAHHPGRCRAVASLCVPYLARGLALPNLVPLVDRALYPAEQYPVGQWDYFLHYREHFAQAVREFEADVAATLAFLYRPAGPEVMAKPAHTASVRARGGWFGPSARPPAVSRDQLLLPADDFAALVEAFTWTGFAGATAWYLNDDANLAYAAEAPGFGRLDLPVLFVHATRDAVCATHRTRLAGPMREDCTDLTEVTIEGGHEIMLEQPAAVSDAIDRWAAANRIWS